MRVRFAVKICAVAVLPAVGALAADWRSEVTEGFWNVPGNWSSGLVPGAAEEANFRGSLNAGVYRAVIPAGGYEDGASTLVNGLKSGTTVTFDALGTTWTKQRAADGSWAGGRILRFDNADHIFNIEGVNAANAADWFGFTFTDGQISFTANDAGDHLNFASGAFDMAFLPDGTPSNHAAIMGYSPHRANAVVELSGGSHKFRGTQVRGQTPNSVFRVSGGDHELWGGLNIKCWDGAADGVVEVTGGSLTVMDNAVWIGHNKNGAGIVRVKGDGTFRNNSGATYFPDVATEQGFIQVSEHGTYVSRAGIAAGHANDSYAEIDVRGDGRLLVTNQLNLAEGGTGSTGVLTVAERGYVYAQDLNGAGGADRVAKVTLQDEATLEVGGGTIYAADTAQFDFLMKGGNFVPARGNDWNIGNNNLGIVNFLVEDGRVSDGAGNDGRGGWNFRTGPGSNVEFRGGSINIGNLRIEGPQKGLTDFTNTVRQTGGEVNIRRTGWGDGLDIRANNRNAMYLLEGGTLRVGKRGDGGMFRLGHAGANNGYHAVFRQTGGTAVLDGVVNMCDAGGSDGEFELLGGVTYAHDIRGWNGSVYRGNTGWARCYFNGGTLKPTGDGVTLIYTMPECSVGENGLTVDTDGLNATISAQFQNDGAGTDNEVDGLFVKAGLGTLTLRLKETDGGAKNEYAGRSLNSDHTYTRVAGGTLLLADAEDCRFGKNVAILGGATLSMTGTPQTLTVDRLALGDGRNFAVLKLDAGDTVKVLGENGIKATCGALDVPFADANGSTPVFYCASPVDADELAKISVFNANPNKEYAWETSENEDGETVCSLLVMARGTHSKTITHAATGRTVSGDGAVSAVIGQVSATESEDLTLARVAALDITGGQTLELASRLNGTGTELVKLGSGLLQVTGDNGGFFGSFKSRGGTLEIMNRRAFGPGELFFPLVLGGGTLAYSGTDGAADFNGALRIDAFAPKKAVVLRNTGDMSFTSVDYVKGAFAKTGTGALTLNLPAGQHWIGSSAEEEYLEKGGDVMLPVSGDSPISESGLYGVNIYEGALRVRGAGIDATTLKTGNTALLGGSYNGTVPAVLDVSNARVDWGAGSRHAMMARDIKSPELAPKIILNNAYLKADSMTIGESAVETCYPEITMNNSTFFDHYSAVLGNATVLPRVTANNSKLYSDAMWGWTVRGLDFARFTGPEALFGSLCVNAGDDRTGSITVQNSFDGEMRFEQGATLAVTRRLRFLNFDETKHLAVVFDGGRFEMRGSPTYPNDASFMGATSVNGFEIEKGGLTVDIADTYEHAITFPFRGRGDWRKTGAGTLCLTNSFSYGVGDVDVALLQTSGESRVAEGKLLVDGAVIGRTAKFVVDADAVLDLNATSVTADTLAGGGTVANGALALTTLKYDAEAQPTFADVSLSGTVNVDFGRTGDDPLDPDEAMAGIVVAHYTGATPTGFRLRAINTGSALPATEFKAVDGDLIVTIRSSGLVLYLK